MDKDLYDILEWLRRFRTHKAELDKKYPLEGGWDEGFMKALEIVEETILDKLQGTPCKDG